MDNFEHLIDTEQIYQHAPSGYLSMLPDGLIIKINQTLLNWLGYERQQVVGHMNFSNLLPKGGGIHYEMFFRPMISVTGNIKELNYELVGAGGIRFAALINANGVMDESKKLLAVNVVITDITQRNLYEKELLLTKNKLQAEKTRVDLLSDLSEELIWTVDDHGEVNYFNRRMSRYFNLDAGDKVSAVIFSHTHPEDANKLSEALQTKDPAMDRFTDRVRLLNNEGIYEWFEIHLVAVSKNVSDIRWFATANSIDGLMTAMERKDDFIHIASHELNTPVTVLKGYLQLMQMPHSPEVMQKFVQKCLASVNNFQFLISSLLNVSVINSGELILQRSDFSMDELLNACVEQLTAFTPSHNIVLDIDSPNLRVSADKDRIGQVVINLMNNAIKYSPGKSEILVRAVCENNTKELSVSVTDYGIGIPADQVERIFEKYYRVKEAQPIKGFGLGLYITQNILMAHGVRLRVESQPGHGTTFSFTLPLI